MLTIAITITITIWILYNLSMSQLTLTAVPLLNILKHLNEETSGSDLLMLNGSELTVGGHDVTGDHKFACMMMAKLLQFAASYKPNKKLVKRFIKQVSLPFEVTKKKKHVASLNETIVIEPVSSRLYISVPQAITIAKLNTELPITVTVKLRQDNFDFVACTALSSRTKKISVKLPSLKLSKMPTIKITSKEQQKASKKHGMALDKSPETKNTGDPNSQRRGSLSEQGAAALQLTDEFKQQELTAILATKMEIFEKSLEEQHTRLAEIRAIKSKLQVMSMLDSEEFEDATVVNNDNTSLKSMDDTYYPEEEPSSSAYHSAIEDSD